MRYIEAVRSRRQHEWAAEHWIRAGLVYGAQGFALAAVVTWNLAVGVAVGVPFGLLVLWLVSPRGPLQKTDGVVSRWNQKLRRRFPPEP